MAWQIEKLNSTKTGAKRTSKRYGLGLPMFTASICRVAHSMANSVAVKGPPR